MKTIFEHIEYAKGKPHHIRKRIAFSLAAGGSAVVALVWFVGSLSLGSFAIQGNTFADSTGQQPVVTVPDNETQNNLAGAAAALPSANAPARIEIIDASTSKSAEHKAEQTTIPF